MPSLRVAHLHLPRREVLRPPIADRSRDVVSAVTSFGYQGFMRASITIGGSCAMWLRTMRLRRRMNVGRGLESRERGPEKVHHAARRARRRHRSARRAASRRMRRGRESFRGGWIIGIRLDRRHDDTRRKRHAPHACPPEAVTAGRNSRGSSRTAIAEPEPDAFRSLVHDRSGVVKRVHREVGEHVEIGPRVRAREHVLEGCAEIA